MKMCFNIFINSICSRNKGFNTLYNMERINCPICKSDKNKIYGKKNGFVLHLCKDCEVIFVWPIQDNLQEIYKENYFKNTDGKHCGYVDYDRDKEPMKEIFIAYLKTLENISSGRKIFDVGSATGYFLDLAKERGWQTAGVEISLYAAKRARAKGHYIICTQKLGNKIRDKFDIVTMWDVLEHLNNPMEYLTDVNKIVHPKGLLVINTVNKDSWFAKLMGIRWHLIVPPEHLFYFSKKSLKIALNQAGFEIIGIGRISKRFSLTYIFKMLYSWQNLKIWHILEKYFNTPFWRKFSIHIDLRDNISILAKKI